MKLQIIYLAAGNSRRFGKNKLLYKLDGKPMYRHLLERLVKICKNHPFWGITVVTQYNEIYDESQKAGIHAVLSEDSRKGISYSINAGIKASPPEADAYAFFVADQPFLTEKTAESFLAYMEQKKAELGSVKHKDRAGNPTWFAARYREELLALSGDTGGRKLLKKYSEKVSFCEVEDAKELEDIDLPPDIISDFI